MSEMHFGEFSKMATIESVCVSTVVLEAQLPCTPCTLWRLKYHVVTIHASTVLQRLQRQLEYGC